ncbi:MAG: MFS transporter, partial [Promethearchaeota archaeon]
MNDTESINGKSDRNADKSAKGNQNKDTLIRKEIYSKQALRFSIFLFFMVLLFDYADQSLTAPLVNTLLTDFFNDTHNVFALGVITFTFTILSAISMIVAGILADIHSRKIICFTGSLIYSTFAILTYFTPHGLTGYHFYFVTRAFNGLGIGAIVPTIFSLVGDLVPKERRSTSFSYITI